MNSSLLNVLVNLLLSYTLKLNVLNINTVLAGRAGHGPKSVQRELETLPKTVQLDIRVDEKNAWIRYQVQIMYHKDTNAVLFL